MKNATKPERVINVRLTDDEHEAFRKASITEQRSMSKMARFLVLSYIKRLNGIPKNEKN